MHSMQHTCIHFLNQLSLVTPLSQHTDSLMKTERPKGPEETPKGGRDGEQTTRTNTKRNKTIVLHCRVGEKQAGQRVESWD